jgi:phytoene desaturase
VVKEEVLIIGAGVGGVYLAARLAKAGFNVNVIEKNDQVGGRCSFLVKDGFSFDTGPTILLMKEVFESAFNDLEEKMEDHLDLIRVEPSHSIFFKDGSKLELTFDQMKLKNQLETFEKKSYDSLKRYLKEGETNYTIGMSQLLDREFNSFSNIINPMNLYYLLKLKALRRHYNYVSKFFKDPRLKQAFTYQDTYLGLNPITAPATFSLLPHLELDKGVWLPKGGMYRIVQSLKEISERFGVTYLLGSPVTRITQDGNQVNGVVLENGQELRGDIIVANADLTYVYNKLLVDKKKASNLNRKKYSCSTLMFYWGLNKKFPELATHNIFMTGDYKLNFHKVMNELTLADDPSFYVHIPSKTDSSRAPENRESCTIVVPVGHLDEKNPQNWNYLREKARRFVIERLNEICKADIEKNIEFELDFTPENWRDQFNLTKGSALGLGHNLRQMCFLRPKNRHRNYKNLFFVGSSNHPGSGVPTVLLSAKHTYNRILRNYSSS